MNRRQLLLSTSLFGVISASGCLSNPDCTESSNHLHLENYASETQAIDVEVFRQPEGLLRDGRWTSVLSETIEVPSQRRATLERVYDTIGTYRTAVQHERRFEEDQTDIDQCDDQVITVGIAESMLSILTGRPDELLPESNTT